jgi:hypothetical protein
MQDLHSSKPEVGDMVAIIWPRTRWDHRQGRLHELRHEQGQRSHAFVLLDGIAVGVPLEQLTEVPKKKEA